MTTYLYIALICTGGRGSFCCTLLACQSIQKTLDDFSRHHQGSQIVCTLLCVDASQGGRDEEGGLSSVTYCFPPFSQHCLLSHRELMFICSRSRLRCEMMICFRFLHQRFYRQIIHVFVGKHMNGFSLSVRPLSLKREKKGIFGISCHRCW